jgi:OOP family OmpA-OmpF porin
MRVARAYFLALLLSPLAAGSAGAQAPDAPEGCAGKLRMRIDFGTGESGVDEADGVVLDMVTEAIRGCGGDEIIRIEGHTDATGTDPVNQLLSEERARAVKLALVQRGIPPDRLRAVGLGGSQPIADSDTPEGRAMNRRVTFMIER